MQLINNKQFEMYSYGDAQIVRKANNLKTDVIIFVLFLFSFIVLNRSSYYAICHEENI